jgi:Predicted bile acid beta-glucosidase
MKSNLILLITLLFSTGCLAQSGKDYPILKHYDKDHLFNIALPLGGIGTGTVSLGGRGELRDWEIMNKPAKGYSTVITGNDAPFFSIYAKTQNSSAITKALMGPLYPTEYVQAEGRPANNHGFPRFSDVSFDAAYPFGIVNLTDKSMPVSVRLIGFNPLVPGDADASGLPLAVLRYEVKNTGVVPVTVSICGNIRNFVGQDGSKRQHNTFSGYEIPFGAKNNQNVFRSSEIAQGIFMYSDSIKNTDAAYGTIALVTTEKKGVSYRCSSVENNWQRATLDFWDDFSADGELTNISKMSDDDPMASLAIKKEIPVGATETFNFFITWNFPNRYSWSAEPDSPTISRKIVGNYYSTKYTDAWDAAQKIVPQIPELEEKTKLFVNSFISSSLTGSVKEAALFNLSTLRSQTVFRIKTGQMMGWEGVFDDVGSCWGSCTHVWNYEQATSFLFGELAMTMRAIEFGISTDSIGLMSFRTELPLETAKRNGRAAADGQMGTILKMYRDWQLSGDNTFLKQYWPIIKKALAFCWIKNGWDSDSDGVMEGCQHNTMDVEYYGPNPQMEFWYLGALRAGEEMAKFMGDQEFAQKCRKLFESGSAWTDANLFNGEYYIQEIRPPLSASNIYPGLQIGMGSKDISNPDFQLGKGCLVDQLVGQYMAHICGLGYLANPSKVKATLESIQKYNFVEDFSSHFNNMRSFVSGKESGLIMASWPNGRLKVPFPYFAESMTGFEYAAAVGMLYEGQTDHGLKCISAIRERFDGQKRNPFDEPECGHHYARAMASWAAILALSDFHYSAIDQSIHFTGDPGNYFWSNGYSWGTCTIKSDGKVAEVVLDVLYGKLELKQILLKDYKPVIKEKGFIIVPGSPMVFSLNK